MDTLAEQRDAPPAKFVKVSRLFLCYTVQPKGPALRILQTE